MQRSATARVIIAGGPRTGKTTLAAMLGRELSVAPRSTDDLIATHGWSEASAEVARWFTERGPWVIEGVACARAMRKYLGEHTSAPADDLIVLYEPKVARTPGQVAMGKACATVFAEIRHELEARGLKAKVL